MGPPPRRREMSAFADDGMPIGDRLQFDGQPMPAESLLPANNGGEQVHQFSSGAKRSEKMPRFDLVPARPHRRLALRYTLGVKYGEWNWVEGIRDRAFIVDMLNHMQHHLNLAKERISKGDMTIDDDDLAAVAWGAFGVMEAQEVWAEDRRNDDIPF
jgi:hypothetical protein